MSACDKNCVNCKSWEICGIIKQSTEQNKCADCDWPAAARSIGRSERCSYLFCTPEQCLARHSIAPIILKNKRCMWCANNKECYKNDSLHSCSEFTPYE